MSHPDLPTRKETDGRVVVDALRLDTVSLVVEIPGEGEIFRMDLDPTELDGEPRSYVESGYAPNYIREMISARLEITVKHETRYRVFKVDEAVRQQAKLRPVEIGTFVVFDALMDAWHEGAHMTQHEAQIRASELEA